MVELIGAGDVPGWLQTSGLVGAVAFGLLSAFVPPLNAEVYALALPLVFPETWHWHILLMTAGFMVGKVSHYVAADRGMALFARRRARRQSVVPDDDPQGRPPDESWTAVVKRVLARWTSRAIDTLERPVLGPLVVFVSGLTGVPPFAVITVAAGVRRSGLVRFATFGTLGCLVRFLGTAFLVSRAAG
ncbi:hypothetical protein [Janibacter melonis]|uniref:hypothetical protein n=1 Tax=Janibacter melonis TaxID=262209 RepID=UPI0020965EB2|nr:hypothetical protein [Janibacter melonis]